MMRFESTRMQLASIAKDALFVCQRTDRAACGCFNRFCALSPRRAWQLKEFNMYIGGGLLLLLIVLFLVLR
jgi:hypothetical protein